jgi:RNA-directed DNA polymerase
VAKETFSKVDHFIWKILWQWACRRHPNKPYRWIKDRYFKSEGLRNWVFGTMVKTEDGDVKMVKLVNASDTPIRRHIKIKAEANPFNPAWEEYFESRLSLQMKESLRGKNKLLILWYMQEGICPNCTEKITKETGWNLHYIQSKTDGGKSNVFNLMILHPNCHRQMHSREKKVATGSRQTGFIEA